MDSWGTILGGWVVVLVVIALYAGWLLLRARVVARDLHLGESHEGTGSIAPTASIAPGGAPTAGGGESGS